MPVRLPHRLIALGRAAAQGLRLWGAERIRGALLKLDIRMAKSPIQRYVRDARPPRRIGQPWATSLRNHALDLWACDFLPVTDLLFRPVYAFFVIGLGTRHPTDAWVAQQRREATPFDEGPCYRIRDNDGKFGPCFDRLAAASGIRVLRTPVRAPRANAVCERFLGSGRRACTDHPLILSEAHLRRMLRAYVAYFNRIRGSVRPSQRDQGPCIGKVQTLSELWPCRS